jgi:hypothetical protein
MATGRSNKLVGQTGEYLIAAELSRRDCAMNPILVCFSVQHSAPRLREIPIEREEYR